MNAAFRFPALLQLCGAYLNREWPEEYGTLGHAVGAYAAETSPARHAVVTREIDELLASNPVVVLATLGSLGCDDFENSATAVAFLRAARATINGQGDANLP